MARGRSRSSYRGKKYSSRSYGQEAAMQHIAEAAALSERLGGMDQEVKKFFFDLDSELLADVFKRYGQRYGADKQAYAEQTLPKWKSGKTQMSGLVAGRLFDLLPPIMPMDLKLRIVEGLFHKSGRARSDYILSPMNEAPSAIVSFVDQTCFKYLSAEGIDASIKRQFHWLSGEDTAVAEKLLNHALQVTFGMKKLATEAMITRLDRDRAENSDVIKDITSAIRLRNHEVRVKRTDAVETIRTVDRMTFERGGRQPEPQTGTSDLSWLWWIVGAGLLIWALSNG